MKQNWYQLEGSKFKELWTILHIPYTFMALSFLAIGFSISKPVNYTVLVGVLIAYFMGLGISAHAFDQLPGMGSSYVNFLTEKELLSLGVVSLIISLGLGTYFIINWQAWHMVWLMPLQGFFAVAYPVAKLFKGFFHTDFWFAVGFGFMPVVIGYYANTLTLSWIIIPFALVCFLISAIEITLSRYVRGQRKAITNKEQEIAKYVAKPEKALKLLCLVTYTLALAINLWG